MMKSWSWQERAWLFVILANLGPLVYNQAIQGARGFMLEKLEDLDATF